ncbi:MAG: hypothetical protein ACRDHI_08575 [Actinomycetota bacterium]
MAYVRVVGMADETLTELDIVIQRLQAMEEAAGVEGAAGGMLHAARTILQELARIVEFGGDPNDDRPL